MFLSAAMMLDWLGERHDDAGSAGRQPPSSRARSNRPMPMARWCPSNTGGTAGTRTIADRVHAALTGSVPTGSTA